MEPSLIAALVAAAAAAGFVDAIAGGGGLITVPVLMLAGLSPEQALATNKVQGSFGAATAAFSWAGTTTKMRSQSQANVFSGSARRPMSTTTSS